MPENTEMEMALTFIFLIVLPTSGPKSVDFVSYLHKHQLTNQELPLYKKRLAT